MTMNDSQPYVFGDAQLDRYRLETQTQIVGSYLSEHAHEFIGEHVTSILDLGCGEGQLGFTLRQVYPDARLVGIDRDPKAIEKAQGRAKELNLANCEFVVGDIEQALPPGPFDLVFASAVLVHTRQPEQVLRLVHEALSPSGQLWISDVHPELTKSSNLPAYQELLEIGFQALAKMGAHPYIGNELPALLAQAGFSVSRTEVEYYPLGGSSREGQAMLAVMVGAVYNGRQMMSKFTGVPVQEIEQRYIDTINAAVTSEQPIGSQPSLNIIARPSQQEQGQ